MRRLVALFLAAVAATASTVRAQAQDELNLALLGTAEQSTTGFGGEASRAIDGNTSGVWGDASISHTAPDDPAPYWQVDLGESRVLQRIVLWNRTDCCPSRLQNFRVSILDVDQQEEHGEDFFTDLVGFPDPDLEIALADGTEGRFVRVDSLGPNDAGEMFVSLAEVQVYGPAEGVPPVIVRQPAAGRVEVGASVEIGVEALGSAPLAYQWSKDDADIDGATDAAMSIESAAFDDAGVYRVVVSNDEGEVTSDPAELVVTGVNLARGAVAIQSTTGYEGEPSRAVDGNTSGVYGNGSVTHTDAGDPAPWWEVRLEADDTVVDTIVLWNRTDACCIGRLTNFRVSVLDVARDEVWSEDFFTDGFDAPDTLFEGFEIDAGEAEGKIVRVERLGTPEDFPGQFFLSLAEVEVHGEGEVPPPPPPSPNLAARPEAAVTQSSTLGAFGPELAVDGILGNFTHTLSGDGPATWEVDLGGVHELATINLHNRSNCCASRLRDITVTILDAGGDEVYQSELLNPENELGGSVEQVGPDVLSIDLIEELGGVVSGQLVRVERTPDEDLSGSGGTGNLDEPWILSLAEVEVLGVQDCPPEGDSHCEGMTVEAPEDGGVGRYVVTAEGTDDSGDLPNYTFTADSGVETRVVGPQLGNRATFDLGVGTWTITVTVDDDPRFCDDVADDAVCTTEIEIAGDPDNVSLGKPATQSTTGFGGVASRAVDGNTNGVYNGGSVTHTATGDPEPWWEVDLLDSFSIDTITLWNRTDCCVERLTNLRVSILDENRDEVFGDDFFTDFTFPDTSLEGFEIDVGGDEGRIVRVALLPGGQYLSLAEVQVSGEPSDFVCPQEGDAEFGDTACSELAASGPEGDVAGAWTFTATATDGTGDSIRYTFEARSEAGVTLRSGPAVGDSTADLELTPGTWTVTVTVDDDQRCDDEGASVRCSTQVVVNDDSAPVFHRGDADGSGDLQLTDGVFVLNFLFTGGATPACMDAADADNSGTVQLTDAVAILGFLFLGGPAPADPGPPAEPCGPDPAAPEDALDCVDFPGC